MNNDIRRVRRFQRAVTTEVSALDASFLGRGRPLGPARVLNAIGNGITEVQAIRRYLKLDSGLMSRLLKRLADDGLIETIPSATDRRRVHVVLTASGDAEYAAYEALADERAQQMLNAHPRPEKLVAAMDTIALLFSREHIDIVEIDPGDARAQACMQAYYQELAERFDEGFDVTLSCDPELADMQAPRGSFLLALADGLAVGCVGLKGTDKGYAEVKRLWVAPEARGLGLSRKLMARLEQTAASMGIALLRLDTNTQLPEAVGFYRKAGWQEIPRFNEDPYPNVFFEKKVEAPAFSIN